MEGNDSPISFETKFLFDVLWRVSKEMLNFFCGNITSIFFCILSSYTFWFMFQRFYSPHSFCTFIRIFQWRGILETRSLHFLNRINISWISEVNLWLMRIFLYRKTQDNGKTVSQKWSEITTDSKTNCEFVVNMYFIRESPCITKVVENKVKGYKKIGKKFRNVWLERDASRGFSL